LELVYKEHVEAWRTVVNLHGRWGMGGKASIEKRHELRGMSIKFGISTAGERVPGDSSLS